MIFLGCDPGATGGVVAIENNKLIYVGRFARESPVAHANQLRASKLLTQTNVSPWLEEVEGWPGEDVKSIFSFGREYGKAQCMFELLELHPQPIDAKDWQSTIGWSPSALGIKPAWANRGKKAKYEYKKARKDWIWHRMEAVFETKLFKDVADAVGIAYAASLKWGL
jgi:hypothetical protein